MNSESFITAVRVAIGLRFFYSGVKKLLTKGWSAGLFLENLQGPFAQFFRPLAKSRIVDELNRWGLTLIGAFLMLGLFTPGAALFGAVLMALYYLAMFRPENELITEHVVYITALVSIWINVA